MKITIAHLYPDVLNLYGDKGNITTLCYRLNKRCIDSTVTEYFGNDKIDFENTDILYIGGGTDNNFEDICQKLKQQKDELKNYIENGGCTLAICSGYQMLGQKSEIGGKIIQGVGVLDTVTKKDKKITSDCIVESELFKTKITGFINKSHTTIAHSIKPLGKVVFPYEADEGIVYKNLIGTYIYGPLLPKNPEIADYIIKCAITKKYGDDTELLPLDDEFETKANEYIINKYIK